MATKPLNPARQPLDMEPDVDLSYSPVPPPEMIPEPPPPEISEGRATPTWRVLFELSNPLQGPIGLDIWRVTVLGRADPMSAFRPDLDYAPYGAMRFGVSRRHALIRPGEDGLYLIDQHSTNGTWVNGQRLLPGQDYRLVDGDVIELGALRMTLRVVQSPTSKAEPERRPERRMRARFLSFLR